MNGNELFKKNKLEPGFASIVGLAFMGFITGWVFLIPAAAAAFLIYGYVAYNKDQKHMIRINYRPSEAMQAIIRREMELKKEKERLMYEQLNGDIKLH